jgi:hypothetical protein
MWAAAQVEARSGVLKNQLITIVECEMNQRNLPPYLRTRIEDDLARKLAPVTAAQVLSLRPERAISLLLFSSLAIYSLAIILSPQILRDEFNRLVLLSYLRDSSVTSETAGDAALNRAANRVDGFEELRLVLTPPAYTRRSPAIQTGDGNIVALAGTRVDVHIETNQKLAAALLSVGGQVAARMSQEAEHHYHHSFVVDQDSNYGLSLVALDDSNQKWEAVYSIRAIKDRPPEVHITSPASDLLLESKDHAATVPIAITARDDCEVALMKLKYIKTTGEGDAAKFESGEIAINRLPDDEGNARGSARLDLAALGVASGSSVVFHAEAFDRNNISGPGTGYSENIIVQVRSPEPVKITLDDLRPDEAMKYLTSQRMILIKTERLHSLRGKIAAGDFLARSQEIATEQKRFKESFNQFTELDASHEQAEDAQEQAELKSGDVPEISAAGNEALREMLASIRAMWKAEGSLGVADTGQAIENEKEALVHLKAAQKGLRYSPPVAARAKPVDLKRRYLGELDGIRSRLERLPRKQESEFDRRLRASLALVYDAARALAQLQPEQAGASQRFNQARQNLERAADDLLSLKGELALSLLEPASKLKLLGRMLGSNESPQEAFGLTVQVASELSALLGRTERAGPALSSNNLPPASRAKAATYFKLLANP